MFNINKNNNVKNEYLSKIMLVSKYQNEREEYCYLDTSGKMKKIFVKTDRAMLASKRILLNGTIGKGSYSRVKHAFDLNKNRQIAVKIIDRERAPKDFQEKFLPREISIWSNLEHTHIIKMYNHFLNDRKIYMCIEYATNGDLLSHVQRLGGPVSMALCKVWMHQMCDAVSYLHSKNIIHRDLKLENLLLDSENNIKLADFGFTRDMTRTLNGLSETYCGSKAYAPPEILLGQPYDPKKADIWAIGVILFIFLTGNMPFKEDSCNQIILEQHKLLKFTWGKKSQVRSHTKQFVKWIFTYEWWKRPSIQDIIENQYFLGGSGTSTAFTSSSTISMSNGNNYTKSKIDDISLTISHQKYNLRRRKRSIRSYADLNCFSILK